MKLPDSVWIAFAEIRKAPSCYFYAVLTVAISIASAIAGLSAAGGLARPLPFLDNEYPDHVLVAGKAKPS